MLGVNVNTTMTELNVTLTGGKTQIETLAAALLGRQNNIIFFFQISNVS